MITSCGFLVGICSLFRGVVTQSTDTSHQEAEGGSMESLFVLGFIGVAASSEFSTTQLSIFPSVTYSQTTDTLIQDTWGTETYLCAYECRVDNQLRRSRSSNEITLTMRDEPPSTELPSNIQATLPVPLWVILLVSGLLGVVILVASAFLVVCLVRRYAGATAASCLSAMDQEVVTDKHKNQEQSDSVWINQDMTKDWTLGRTNMVFHKAPTPETELSHPAVGKKDSLTFNGSATAFSTFRT